MNKRQLQVHDVMQDHQQIRPHGLALSLIDDLPTMKKQAVHKLQFPPQQPRDLDDDEPESKGSSTEITGYDEPPEEDTAGQDDPELPPELQPVLMDDGFPPLPDDEDFFDDDPDTPSDYDELDLKNTPDFDPDQDHEAKFYTDDIDTWIKADEEETIKGARPRLYERLNVIKETHPDVIQSKDHDMSPITCQ